MRILAATNNQDKLIEFHRILEPLGISLVTPSDLDIEIQVPETGETFKENARIKAQAFHRESGLPCVADDSGLCVDALDGRPGVDTANYCGEDATYPERMSALLEELKDVPPERRTAKFVSVICCVMDEETVFYSEGVCEGSIGIAPAGEGGFGYDPIFVVGGKTMAERSAEDKDMLSHRGKSLRAFAKLLEEQI
ncbi:MAG: RdgB/HAM1 family non-canonical purine NTP pyrophosphatase [Oscillospiraceae bacterium]|nr:RdgB/HAM1 family non-canonical purine NTP pyrophosphatase [Oscillospiraceae bacterium]